MEILDRPLQILYADLLHNEKTNYLSMIDGFFRTAYTYRIKSKRANELTRTILTFFGKHVISQKLCVDKGRVQQ